jgi:hypothetical protein
MSSEFSNIKINKWDIYNGACVEPLVNDWKYLETGRPKLVYLAETFWKLPTLWTTMNR